MSATLTTKIEYPQESFRILGSTLADRWVGEDWKITTDPEYNFLYVDVDMSFDLARRTHKYPRAPFGAKDSPWCVQLYLHIYTGNDHTRDEMYPISMTAYGVLSPDKFSILVCSPDFLRDAARTHSIDPILSAHSGLQPLVLDWLDMVTVYDFMQHLLCRAHWPRNKQDYKLLRNVIRQYVFDDSEDTIGNVS